RPPRSITFVTQRRPVPGRNVRPRFSRIRMNSFKHDESLVALRCGEAGPQRAGLITVCSEWFHTITETLKTVRRRVQLAGGFSDPTDNDLSFTVTESRNASGKARRKLL